MKECTGCQYLSIDEKEQNFIKKQGGGLYPHICRKYKKRVLHTPYKEPYIHPCDECIKENENKTTTEEGGK